MEAAMEQSVKTYKELQDAQVSFTSGSLRNKGGNLFVDLVRSQTVLPRHQSGLQSTTSYLINGKEITPLQTIPTEKKKVLAEKVSPCGEKRVVFRKGEKDEKEVWVEVWEGKGVVNVRSVGDVVGSVYNDTSFGGIRWNAAGDRVCFIGEIPPPKKYENYFDPKHSEKKDKKDEEMVWNSKKYEYEEDFGETLVGKKRPGIFVYSLETNQLQQVDLSSLPDVYPAYPSFDKSGTGLVFQGVFLPYKKLGLNYCLNRPTSLYHLPAPNFISKEKADDKKEEGGEKKEAPLAPVCLTQGLYLAFHPHFSSDRTKLVFFGREEKFFSHTANFELFSIDFSGSSPSVPTKLIPRFPSYPTLSDNFAGVYGYQFVTSHAQFLGESNNFFLFISPCKARTRLYSVDLTTKEVKWVALSNKGEEGEYDILDTHGHQALVTFSTFNTPPQAHLITFSDDLCSHSSFLIDQMEITCDSLREQIASIQCSDVNLENGAEAQLYYLPVPENASPRPMVLIIHGGPFGMSPRDAFIPSRNLYILQGYGILVVNYRGSTSFGEDFMNALVGTIGEADVSDCANLAKEALKKYPKIVDPERVGTFGGSHGGFLTGWLIGHPEFRTLFKAGCLWNPVTNMSFMTQTTDIPDWITACCEGKEFEYGYSAEANDLYFKKSPFSVVTNVECPTLLVVGTKDFRVPPQQSYLYYNTLKSRNVPAKLMVYPETGHALAECEFGTDAVLNISAWFNKYL